jgi:LmbE family N-acetylglucosaminyl deacetylase/GT2 family glycosyltransferase
MSLAPPGHTEQVTARRALVLAPDYDDEVLGCGGLLAQLTAADAAVHVLFLTDGAGGVEAIEDRPGHAARRRAESERAARVLGLARVEHAALPDGGLAAHLDAAAGAIRRALLAQRPDLVLVPSPLEATSDHRAAFAALHRVLAPLRGDDDLDAAVAGLRVLLYEVNHPAYPDLLVDVTAVVPRIEAAMACYTSQEAHRPYLAAALGLRRFRALSLDPGDRAIEAYRRLTPADFSTRSLARLIHDLGGVPIPAEGREGPLVSVIVRTRNRPELLREALESLAAGTYRRVEVIVVNDGGLSPCLPAAYALPLVPVDLPGHQGRAAAANAGVARATGEYVTFLDDDDLADPEHLSTLVGIAGAAGVRVAYTDAAVGIYELDAEHGWRCVDRRLTYSRDFDGERLLVDNYIPLNTLIVERRLLVEAGPFDVSLPFFEDWDMLIRLAALAPFHHLRRVTCEYRHFRGARDQVFGERPDARGDFLTVKARVLAKHAAHLRPEVLARAITRLREEADGLAALRARVHAQTAEIASQAETITGQTATIARLTASIRAIEASRTWRLRTWWRRRFP